MKGNKMKMKIKNNNEKQFIFYSELLFDKINIYLSNDGYIIFKDVCGVYSIKNKKIYGFKLESYDIKTYINNIWKTQMREKLGLSYEVLSGMESMDFSYKKKYDVLISYLKKNKNNIMSINSNYIVFNDGLLNVDYFHFIPFEDILNLEILYKNNINNFYIICKIQLNYMELRYNSIYNDMILYICDGKKKNKEIFYKLIYFLLKEYKKSSVIYPEEKIKKIFLKNIIPLDTPLNEYLFLFWNVLHSMNIIRLETNDNNIINFIKKIDSLHNLSYDKYNKYVTFIKTIPYLINYSIYTNIVDYNNIIFKLFKEDNIMDVEKKLVYIGLLDNENVLDFNFNINTNNPTNELIIYNKQIITGNVLKNKIISIYYPIKRVFSLVLSSLLNWKIHLRTTLNEITLMTTADKYKLYFNKIIHFTINGIRLFFVLGGLFLIYEFYDLFEMGIIHIANWIKEIISKFK
jgi:hypothetical protein